MKGELHPSKKPLERRTLAPCAYFLAYGWQRRMGYFVFWCGDSRDSSVYYYVTVSWVRSVFTLRDAIIPLVRS